MYVYCTICHHIIIYKLNRFTLREIMLNYIRKPVTGSINCREHCLDEILAARMPVCRSSTRALHIYATNINSRTFANFSN